MVALGLLASPYAILSCNDNNAPTIPPIQQPGQAPSPSPTPSPSPSAAPATVQTSAQSIGTFLVDAQGRSLYMFEADSSGVSNCSGACALAWPPLTIASGQTPTASGSAEGSLLGTLTRGDGSIQVTYKGMPLYRFAADTAAGQTNGEGVTAFGALWYLVQTDGSALTDGTGGY